MKLLLFLDADAVWTLAPLVGFLWSIGGSGPKLFRRLGVPTAVTLYALSLGLAWYLAILQWACLFGVTTLPYGDKIRKKLGKFYWPFVFLVGALYGASLLPLSLSFGHWMRYVIGLGACLLTFGGLTLSSQKLKWPVWKWVEILIGAVIGATAAWLIA